jgi:hypothetical protein
MYSSPVNMYAGRPAYPGPFGEFPEAGHVQTVYPVRWLLVVHAPER